MKIKNLAIIILMTTFFIILGTKVYAATGTINDKTVNLKKAPDSKVILDYLNKGDEVEILEQNGEWCKVKAQTEQGKVTGYVSTKQITFEEDSTVVQPDVVQEQPVETNNNVEIKENNKYTLQKEIITKIIPLINSKEKEKIAGEITVIEIINDWARIENDTQSGWIRKNILKGMLENVSADKEPDKTEETQPEETQPEETQPEKTEETSETISTTEEPTVTEINKVGYVSAEGLRVRKEPTTDSEEIDSFSKNHKVEIIGQVGNWYKIKLEDGVGYVSAKYISDTKVLEVTSRSGSTLKKEITVKNEKTSEQQENDEVEQEEIVQSTNEETGADEVVEYAKNYLGYKYVAGGASPATGFDCSGFTQYVYKNFGITLNRTSKDQIKNGVAVEKDDLQLGDIVIFNNEANTAIGHVGIYVGEGNFIHASNPKGGVKITTLTTGYYAKRYVGARRVI